MEQQEDDKVHLFFGKYRIIKRIGCGSFGNVYKGINTIDNKNVAIKIEKKEDGYNLLQKESYYLYNLRGIGIPELISYGYSGKYNVLVQTLLGESLGKIFFKNNNHFHLKDICMFTIQILHRIEFVHSKYLIHRDIKPENFLIGSPDEYLIYIIDFGLSKKYKSSRTNKHIQFQLTKKFTGTARYASINAVRGAEQSRRDDLEAIGYMLMFFFNGGKLPWQGVSCKEKAQKYAKIYNMKMNLNYEEFCKNMPREIIAYMIYCRELPFEKEPNYEYLRNLFEIVLQKNCMKNDLKFSWISDISILKNIKEIKNKILPTNSNKRKQRLQTRIYKQLESSRDKNNNNNKEQNDNKENNYKLLINNNSQNNLLQKSNPILKAQTFNLKYNFGHKRFNSSYDISKLKGKESEMMKSSIAKYNSSIDDEEGNNVFLSNNSINIKNIYEKNNLIISNNGNYSLNKDNSKNNLFYFSNFNDLTKSFTLKKLKNNNENTFNVKIKSDNENNNKTNRNPNLNIIKRSATYYIKNNKNERNKNHSPNIIKSFSYVKKYKNKIDEININFNDNKNARNPKDNNIKYLTNNNNSHMIPKNKINIIYNKKNGCNLKISDLKNINKNNGYKNNVTNINPIQVNKSKNLVNSKIKIKKPGNNIIKSKKIKILKTKPQNIKIQVSPINQNSKSYKNIIKKIPNNSPKNLEYFIHQNKNISKPTFKKERIKTHTHNLSTNFSNNIEGKINKIKTMNIHSNIKKHNNSNYKKINTDEIFKTNTNDLLDITQKRINKYKNLRHKINVKNNNLTLTKNDIKNPNIIPKSHMIHKTINSTINNCNNTISNTINSNNNNNTIISIYNNYNINKNNSNGIYKGYNEINIDLDSLNNNNNKNNNNFYSYNGYNYHNYINLNAKKVKNPIVINKQKINKIVDFPSIIPSKNYDNNNTFNNQIINRDYSYQENEPINNLKNYFSINSNITNDEHKKNKIMNLSSVRLNLNSLKIKNILSDLKYKDSFEISLSKNKKEYMNSNTNILENKTFKKNNNFNHSLNIDNNRYNSLNSRKKVSYKDIIHKNNKQKYEFEYNYPSINRKKTDIFYQRLPEYKMNFDIDDSGLIQDDRNNTPSFRRYDKSRDCFNNYLKDNNYISLKF